MVALVFGHNKISRCEQKVRCQEIRNRLHMQTVTGRQCWKDRQFLLDPCPRQYGMYF